MNKTQYSIGRFTTALVILFIFSFQSPVSAQYFGWARNQIYANYGSTINSISTDEFGNFFVSGRARFCLGCSNEYYTSMYNKDGNYIKGLYSIEWDEFRHVAAAADFSGELYGLGYSTYTDDNFIQLPSGVKILIGVSEGFDQLKVDSAGNMFVSNGLKARRYNASGSLMWEYNSINPHSIQIDRYRNCYLSDLNSLTKISPTGSVVLQLAVNGKVTVDKESRLYVADPAGLKKLTRFGVQLWQRPAITGPVQLNDDLFIFESQGTIIKKYNSSGTSLLWSFDALSSAVVGATGGIFTGGNYSGFPNVKPCPYKFLPGWGWGMNQSWIAGIVDGQPAVPQIAVYTGVPFTTNGNTWLGNHASVLCPNKPIVTNFEYCISGNGTLPQNHQFTLEISGDNGTFNLGPVQNAVMPNLTSLGTYQFTVRSSVPSAICYSNDLFPEPTGYLISNYTFYPHFANLSLSGTQNMCQGQAALNLSVDLAPYTMSYGWRKDGNYLSSANAIQVNTTGVYSILTESQYCGWLIPDPVQVNVNPRPNPIVSVSGPTSFCAGDSVVLSVTDVDMSTIKWRESGVGIAGASLANFTATTSGNYTVRVVNSFGCAKASTPVFVDVNCREAFESSRSNKINFYPNPTSDFLNIEFGSSLSVERIEISDVTGKLVGKFDAPLLATNSIQLDVQSLKPGTYFIRVAGTDLVMTEKFVKGE